MAGWGGDKKEKRYSFEAEVCLLGFEGNTCTCGQSYDGVPLQSLAFSAQIFVSTHLQKSH